MRDGIIKERPCDEFASFQRTRTLCYQYGTDRCPILNPQAERPMSFEELLQNRR